jgi:hypothetical protein
MTYQPKPGDRVLIPATYVGNDVPTVKGDWPRVVIGSSSGTYLIPPTHEVLPDERPGDPTWWPPQPGDVALFDSATWVYDGSWWSTGGRHSRKEAVRGADLIARDGKRWPTPMQTLDEAFQEEADNPSE